MAGVRWRIGAGVALAVLLLPVGFVAGGLYAWLTPEDPWMGAGAVAALKGLMGGVLGLVAGGVLGFALPARCLRRAVLIAGALSVLAVLFIGFRIWTVRVAASDPGAARPWTPGTAADLQHPRG